MRERRRRERERDREREREREREARESEEKVEKAKVLKKRALKASAEDSFELTFFPLFLFFFSREPKGGQALLVPPFFSASCAPLPQAPPSGGARSRAERSSSDICLGLRSSTQRR